MVQGVSVLLSLSLSLSVLLQVKGFTAQIKSSFDKLSGSGRRLLSIACLWLFFPSQVMELMSQSCCQYQCQCQYLNVLNLTQPLHARGNVNEGNILGNNDV